MSSCACGEAIVIVGPEEVGQSLRKLAGAALPIARVDDTFGALERLAEGGARVVFVWAGSLPSRADAALAGMRQMLDVETRMILIVRPDEEPLARGLLGEGLDDYLLWPMRGAEVRQVLAGLVEPAAEIAEREQVSETEAQPEVQRAASEGALVTEPEGATGPGEVPRQEVVAAGEVGGDAGPSQEEEPVSSGQEAVAGGAEPIAHKETEPRLRGGGAAGSAIGEAG